MVIAENIKKCHRVLEAYYGSQFKGLVLYGSTVRNQAERDSDIDLLVLLDTPVDYFLELRRIIELLYPVQLDTQRLISAKPADANEYESGSISLYRNAKREGMLV
jgi:predicted nucleotidyltransferase